MKYRSNFYLTSGPISVSRSKMLISKELLDLVARPSTPRICSLAISASRRTFNPFTVWLIVGLCMEIDGTQDIAISTNFQRELISKFPFNLGSTTFLISPFAKNELIQ
uniref:Uncharacterized protein MANES_04G136000 n=1 Tax=Rhizophora mucronata TaxID=61149 RepID=A0A2P2MWZ6_RHIMU